MLWLEDSLTSRGDRHPKLTWCCSPTITHFRPAHMYSHWPDGSPVSKTTFIKMESLEKELSTFLDQYGFNRTDQLLPHKGSKGNSTKTRSSICSSPLGCSDMKDVHNLLEQTPHTEKTIEIVNRLYSQDFELHGYCKIMMEGDAMDIECPHESLPKTEGDSFRAILPNLPYSMNWAAFFVYFVFSIIFVGKKLILTGLKCIVWVRSIISAEAIKKIKHVNSSIR